MLSNSCVHCGANCGKNPIVWNDKSFCCEGCSQVYQILNENKLTTYYNLQDSPGIKVEIPSHDSKYAFLDKDDVQKKLFSFYEDGIAKVTFYIPSIHCASCVWLLENLHKLNKGVRHASVNFVKKEYTVSFKTDEISLRSLVELLASIHYIPDISLQTLEKKNPEKSDKKLLFKVGVAGFVFGNVMLYSLPEYFNGKPLEDSLGGFLYWVTYLLTLPVVFYSGSDYLISAFKNLRKGIVNIDLPIAIGILTLFSVTSYEVISGSGPGYSDSLAGFLFFLLIGKWYQSKTYEALSFDRDYKSYFPVAVTKMVDEKEESILLEEVEVGNTLLIRNKELIPADSILVDGIALIDYSFVTGESNPVRKNIDDVLYAGGVQTGGAIRIKVNKEVKQSHLTQLWNQSGEKAAGKKSLISIIDNISVYFTIVIIVIALAGFSYWWINGTVKQAVLVLTSVLIVACPCALALSLPFTFGNAMRMLGNKGMYIKNTEVIEKLTQIDTMVFDKTGTITKPDESSVVWNGEKLSVTLLQQIVSLARQSAHPLSYALSEYYKHIESLPTVGYVEVSGRGIFATVTDDKIRLGSKEYVAAEKVTTDEGKSVVFVEVNEYVLGYFAFSNMYREGFEKVIGRLGKFYDLYLLSGDNDSERKNLSRFFNADQIHFNQQPKDKMAFIESLKKEGRKVMMTGDGLNDAGAFLESDVALSIADDIYHFSPAGDAIIEASKFEKIYRFIAYAKQSMSVLKWSFVISLMYNVLGLSFAITGNLSPVIAALLMPISSVTVVAFATFATRALGNKI